jgi:membrane-associated protease RseP (regulator of RpoE activity)
MSSEAEVVESYVPAPAPVRGRWARALQPMLLVLTLLSTTMAGATWAGVPLREPRDLLQGLPYSVTLLAILLCHESGHYLMCRRYGVAASLPWVIPAPPQLFWFGTFGAVIRIRGRFPDRRALFDIGAGGPWAGFVVALVATIVGLRLSTVLPAPPSGPIIEFGDSLLTGFLTRLVLHADPATVILHPVALAGWFGLFVTSLNLLPAGQLDGGHILYAASGRPLRAFQAVVIAALVWLGVRVWPGWILWAIITVVMVGMGHPTTMIDERPLGRRRQVAALASLVLFVLTFVAEPIRIPMGTP